MSSTLLPFLYQTRTLQRAVRGPLPALVRALHATPTYRHPRSPPRKPNDDDSVPFDFAPDQQGLDVSRRRRDKESTITETEKRVFDGIFGAIGKRRKQLGGGPIFPNIESRYEESWGHEPAEAEKEDEELNRERILSMYPAPLRRSAEIALGLQGQEDKQGLPEGHVPHAKTEAEAELDAEMARRDAAAEEHQRHAQRAIVQFHEAEKERVRGLMRSCKNDTAVWQVLEEHVFSMVANLGIGNPEPTPKRKGEKAPTRRNRAPPAGITMARYGPLYSLHLLSGLRVLDRSFETPSPLALNVLPRVLEMGMASYVLGVSTQFYNELMSIYWYRHGNTAAVLKLMRDMERAGLAPDGHTRKIIEAMTVAISGLTDDSEGRNPFGEVLSTMVEYDSMVLSNLESRRDWALAAIEERVSELPL